jgi:thiosulfate/3-mercaptopyruvate sulfurtransferase
LVLVLAGCSQRLALPGEIPPATVAPFPGNAEPPLLVDAASLSARLSAGDGHLVILDASELRRYRAGHIPGAVHAWWQDTMDPNGPVYGTVLKPDNNISDPQLLRRHFIEDLGVTPDDDVVVYDDAGGRWAARLVWALRFLGYSRAAMLDGGLGAWRGIGAELESRENEPAIVANPAIDPQRNWYLVTGELLEQLNEPDLVVLDVRTSEERADDVDGTIEPGSIPNSIAIPWTSAVADEHGHFLPPDQLRSLFENAGVTPERTIVLLARFGAETAHTWLALKLLGYPNVLIYDGGWVDWAAHQETPKEAISVTVTT